MSNVYITDSDKFEEIISTLESSIPNIEDIFNNQNNNFNSIDGTDIWQGDTQRVISSKYDELSQNFTPIVDTLRDYIKYLKITINNYKNLENKIDKSIDENLENLNVN